MPEALQKLLWGVFTATVAVLIYDAAGYLLRGSPDESAPLDLLRTLLPASLLLCHAAITLGARRAVGFILLAAGVGAAAEACSLSGASLFGAPYEYLGLGPKLLGLPAVVPMFWAVFIYTGYSLTTSFLRWLGWDKPCSKAGGARLLAASVAADGLIVVAIDLILDPVMVRAGQWRWFVQGGFGGVPSANFLGWFGVVALCTGLFRTFEYFRPNREQDAGDLVHLMPVVGYAVVCAWLTAWALHLLLVKAVVVGCLVMGAVASANVLLFLAYRGKLGFDVGRAGRRARKPWSS